MLYNAKMISAGLAALFVLLFAYVYFFYTKIFPMSLTEIKNPITDTPTPSATRVRNKSVAHDTTIADHYAWLRDKEWPNAIQNVEVTKYLESENKYYQEFAEKNTSQKEMFFEELKGRIKLADQSVYSKKDDYYYYTRTEEHSDYPIYCRKHGSIDATEEILLDINELAHGKKFISIGAVSVSPDHKLIAYSVDFTGGEKYTIKLFDLETQKLLPDQIERTIGSIVWHEKLNGFFYSPVNDKWRQDTVKFHTLGNESISDITILHESNPLYSVSVLKSSSKDYIFINVGGHDSNEIFFISMDDLEIKHNLFTKRKDHTLYSVDHDGKYFYQSTNDGAKNFHLLKIASHNYSSDLIWDVYIQEKSEKYLAGFDITQKYLLLNYVINGLDELVVRHLDQDIQNTLTFPDASYVASIYSTNFEENDIRINYSSLARPNSVYSYDALNDTLAVLKVQEIPSGFNSSEYQVERVYVKTDGVEVPVSLMYKKSLFKHDGSNPLYLYGYGSYGIGISASFRNSAISLVDRGFVYAIAHIRGGDDLGHDWYEAAKFLNKKRTFNDFIACAEQLVKDKYTSHGNIVIMGGSAGGMLIGNVINRRPTLFKAAIAHVPFVDVLNTMMDSDLPLTPGEYKEWGNPEEREYFDYIKSYSPYDNVKPQHYPHLFVTAGLSDPRVGYWEAAKWVAKIRHHMMGNNIVLYKTNMDFGHSGASSRFDHLKEAAEDLVFIKYIFQI